jgi:hypothetical protein
MDHIKERGEPKGGSPLQSIPMCEPETNLSAPINRKSSKLSTVRDNLTDAINQCAPGQVTKITDTALSATALSS